MVEAKNIPIDLIHPNPYQPRLEFEDTALLDLAQSIRENGLIQPITLRQVEHGYEIVAGERRFRAMKLNGMVEVPAMIMNATEVQMAEMALVENIQRENLSAIEEAKAYVQIMRYSGMNQSQLALRMGKSQSSIANKIRLLNLNQEIQDAISTKKISERHARALLSVEEEKRSDVLHKIIDKGWNVAQTEKMIKEKQTNKPKTVVKGMTRNLKIALNTIRQAVQMVERSGCQVQVKETETEDEVIVELRFPK